MFANKPVNFYKARYLYLAYDIRWEKKIYSLFYKVITNIVWMFYDAMYDDCNIYYDYCYYNNYYYMHEIMFICRL